MYPKVLQFILLSYTLWLLRNTCCNIEYIVRMFRCGTSALRGLSVFSSVEQYRIRKSFIHLYGNVEKKRIRNERSKLLNYYSRI